LSYEMPDLDALIKNFEEYIAKVGKRKACRQLVELGGVSELFDEKIERVFELLSEFCGGLYVAKFKQTLRARLLAYGSPITPEFISTFGITISQVISNVLDPNVSLTTLKRDFDKIAERHKINIRKEALVGLSSPTLSDAIFLSEVFWHFLNKIGMLDHPEFLPMYSSCLKRIGDKITVEKTIISVRPLFYVKSVSVNFFEDVLRSLSNNFDGLLGFSISAAYSMISYMLQKGSAIPSISSLLAALAMDSSEMLAVYERAFLGDESLVYLILNKIVSTYYRGPIFKVIDGILSGKLRAQNAIELLLHTPYTTASIQNIRQTLEFIVRVSEKLLSEKGFERQVFNLITKIAFEARPAIIRRFLETDEGRVLLIELIKKLPSRLVLVALNRLISTYAPMDRIPGRRSGEDPELLETLNSIMPNWRYALDIKTVKYLNLK